MRIATLLQKECALQWPQKIIIDPRREFMGDVTSLFEKHKVSIEKSEAGNHHAQAFVKRANRTLTEKLFSHQYAQQNKLMITNDRSRVWVKEVAANYKDS